MPPISELSICMVSTDQPRFDAYAVYISIRSRANKLASSPPSAPRISMMTGLPSFSSGGSNSTCNCASSSSTRVSAAVASTRNDSRSSPVVSIMSSLAAAASPRADHKSRIHCTSGVSCLYLRDASRRRFWSPRTSGLPRLTSSSL